MWAGSVYGGETGEYDLSLNESVLSAEYLENAVETASCEEGVNISFSRQDTRAGSATVGQNEILPLAEAATDQPFTNPYRSKGSTLSYSAKE